MLLNVQECTGQPHSKDLLTPNVKCMKLKDLWSRGCYLIFDRLALICQYLKKFFYKRVSTRGQCLPNSCDCYDFTLGGLLYLKRSV